MPLEDTCSICYESNINYTTDCNHDFCNQCITSWLLSNNNCPLCRKEFYDIAEEPIRNIDDMINQINIIIYIWYLECRYIPKIYFNYYKKISKNVNNNYHNKKYRFDNTNFNHIIKRY